MGEVGREQRRVEQVLGGENSAGRLQETVQMTTASLPLCLSPLTCANKIVCVGLWRSTEWEVYAAVMEFKSTFPAEASPSASCRIPWSILMQLH